MMLKMAEIKLHEDKDHDRLFGQNVTAIHYMKKRGPTEDTEGHRIFFVTISLYFFCVILCFLWALN
jgi:hypothetical protein